jgi:hypothetical protein
VARVPPAEPVAVAKAVLVTTSPKNGKADDKTGQQHVDRGFSLGFGKGAEKAERPYGAESAWHQCYGFSDSRRLPSAALTV